MKKSSTTLARSTVLIFSAKTSCGWLTANYSTQNSYYEKTKVLDMIKKLFSKIATSIIQGSGHSERIAFESMRTVQVFRRLQTRGIKVNSVFDVGASNGSWSIDACKYWPDARYHLIEANSLHEKALKTLCGENQRFSYVLAAASDAPGTIYFDDSDPFGGLAAKANESKPNAHAMRAVTLDEEAKTRALKPPYLVKLDTHGFEVPILNGAIDTLKNSNLVVIEAYNFQIESESLKFYQMCQFMDDRGFAVIDISEPLWREKDKAFWQMDLFFVPKTRPEFSYNRYT